MNGKYEIMGTSRSSRTELELQLIRELMLALRLDGVSQSRTMALTACAAQCEGLEGISGAKSGITERKISNTASLLNQIKFRALQ